MSWTFGRRGLLILALALGLVSLRQGSVFAQWLTQNSGTKARLRGLAVVNTKVVWASGSQGTFVRTTDGGTTWSAGTVSGGEDLDFRDVHAASDRKAFLLSIGEGPKSRIYTTGDGGSTWALRFRNDDPKGFLDALAFWDADHGIAMGDPVDGRFTILTTEDGGIRWNKARSENMPLAKNGEGAFAASGTCLVVTGDRHAWFGTGGADVSRVFRSTDRGQTWTVHDTPIQAANPSSGVFSLAFADQESGVAVGGDFKLPRQANLMIATTSDGGRHWTKPKGPLPSGYRSAVAFVPGTINPTLVAVGPTGSDFSADGGETWMPLGNMGFHAVGFAGPIDGGWGVGDDGLIARYQGSLDQVKRRLTESAPHRGK
jgi:photosystem II stability/assembly factor-like uncharacterized protein